MHSQASDFTGHEIVMEPSRLLLEAVEGKDLKAVLKFLECSSISIYSEFLLYKTNIPCV